MFVFTMLLELPARSVMSACRALINGVGAVRFSMIVGLLDAFLGRILFTYLLGDVLGLGAFGYFLGFSLATYVTAIPEVVFFLCGKWKKKGQILA